MKAYRVENQEKGHGIWRDFDGTVNPVFSKLTQGKCKDMPMEDSDFYRQDGKQWFSATDTPEKLKAWFSALDVAEMEKLGYKVYEFEISHCRAVSEYEICFTRDCIISQREIDPRSIYGVEYDRAVHKEQIEEMAKVICSTCRIELGPCECENPCQSAIKEANELYNAGCRMQSEGEWVVKGVYFKRLECSACNCIADSIYARTPYCPHCGAKMKGGE